MAKRTSKYAMMSASDLARETRERGLQKPDVNNIGDWATWLEERDAESLHPAKEAVEPVAATVEVPPVEDEILPEGADDHEEAETPSGKRKKAGD